MRIEVPGTSAAPTKERTKRDFERILGRCRDNGSDFWATADGRWGVRARWRRPMICTPDHQRNV
ncbi:MAG TPA: hypothetical protein VMW31_01180 [Devosiaceae bacterium]|nr:hypothetical protein [Devosiaceae bacterium]